jgi:hypothetical protein
MDNDSLPGVLGACLFGQPIWSRSGSGGLFHRINYVTCKGRIAKASDIPSVKKNIINCKAAIRRRRYLFT